MSFHFLPELVADYLDPLSWDGRPSAPWRKSRIAERCCLEGRGTVCCPCSQFGMIYGHSTDGHGLAKLMSLRLEFPASHGRQLAKDGEKTTIAISGPIPLGSFAKWNPDSASWKTSQASLIPSDLLYTEQLKRAEVIIGKNGKRSVRLSKYRFAYHPTSDEFLETWPQRGTMLNGECWERQMWGLLTGERESGLLPTPSASSYGTNQGGAAGRVGPLRPSLETMAREGLWPKSLTTAVKTWPTPSESAAKQGQNKSDGRRGQTLVGAARGQMWPTPTIDGNYNRKGLSKTSGDGLATVVAQTRKTWLTPKTPTGGGKPQRTTKGGGLRKLEDQVAQEAVGQLNPQWVEWLMGWPSGWTALEELEPEEFKRWERGAREGTLWTVDPADNGETPRVAKAVPHRVARLRAIGNGQVPATVFAAWSLLSEEQRGGQIDE